MTRPAGPAPADTDVVGYRVLADTTVVVHLAFLAYVVGGGFLAWRWPKLIWPHLALAGWGFSTVVFGLNCPLTYLEDWARRRGGEPGLSQGFIDHYLTGVIYPAKYKGLMKAAAAGAVLVSWVGFAVRQRRAHRPLSSRR